MTSETANSDRSHSYREYWNPGKMYVYVCSLRVTYIFKKKKKRTLMRQSQRFSPTLPRGSTVVKRHETGESSTTLLPPSSSILPATDTLNCHYLFLHSRICLPDLYSFFSILLSCRGHAAQHSLLVLVHCLPLLLPRGELLLWIFEALRATHTFILAFILRLIPLLLELFQSIFC